ncbi:MAG: D-alanyl-D-alanine carboxypeptidase [Candidatus Doudnabacteria bacterium]|nr:D-alanyl-D-alanine carboxypeptidase [Candidatus Doudnabacteria bacterium]
MQNFRIRFKRAALKILVYAAFLLAPASPVLALQIQDFVSGAQDNGMTAKAYLVLDKLSGQVLLQKESQKIWTPASLTKLVTALVVLDHNPSLGENISMAKADEVGGARVSTRPGVTYRIKDLFYATLVASANNAANAIARSSGLSKSQFIEKMNQKARELGAKSTLFFDPSGIGEKNYTTAEDFAKIAKAAFEKPQILSAAKLNEYSFRSVNNRRFSHKIKNTNKLLADGSLNIIAGKTGYLDKSRYNFVGLIKDQFGREDIVVLLGAENSQAQFWETKQLTFLAGLAKPVFGFGGMALGEGIYP